MKISVSPGLEGVVRNIADVSPEDPVEEGMSPAGGVLSGVIGNISAGVNLFPILLLVTSYYSDR